MSHITRYRSVVVSKYADTQHTKLEVPHLNSKLVALTPVPGESFLLVVPTVVVSNYVKSKLFGHLVYSPSNRTMGGIIITH